MVAKTLNNLISTEFNSNNTHEKTNSALVKNEDKIISKIDSDAEDTDLRKLGTDFDYKFKYRHVSVFFYFILIHIWTLYGVYYCFGKAKTATVLWGMILIVLCNQAVVLAAHRAYSHRSFKPTKALKFALILFQTMAGQNDIIWWARDHRVHHKYVDTDADPYNATRGFFFAQIGWLMVEKHPLVTEKSKQIDISDLLEDDWLMFQRRHFLKIFIVVGFLFPVFIPYYIWGENWWISFCIAYCLRHSAALHSISTINSFGHMYGTRPFDKRINPVQSKLVHWMTGGDGWHNFHHCFPWDYGLSEFGYGKGLSTRAIEFFAKHGYAYDLKKASTHVIQAHSKRHGDGTHTL